MNRENLKQQLKIMLVSGLRLTDIDPATIDDNAPIFVEGLGLDSIDALELVVLVEEHFGVVIPDEDTGKTAFASVEALADFILANQKEPASQQV